MMSVKLVSPEQFRDTAMKSALDWYEFAKKRYGIQHHDLDRSLYLITGFYKARSWSLGSFNNHMGATGRILARRKDKNPKVYPLCSYCRVVILIGKVDYAQRKRLCSSYQRNTLNVRTGSPIL
ncbi:hypothetical protein L210DRAFT_3560718 [Boletus edulis BED1]|uniref:Uncharacterized protein n=1 Tax=Boletus edulis BED1 TaxID=1328754 RepID=A0AAD4G5Q8_BOLED|nr:hypothetical protein L210DRAFT_3586241 [Boletus edulis BED1]KAF8431302.1 hypothetical protein L210DRAFT_3560718 [Boletus edulis BED1]